MNSILTTHLQRLHDASNQGKLVVFIGAGVSANSGVPTWNDLINALKKDLPQSINNETDDLKVAQIFKDTRDSKEYFETIRSVLKDGKVSYNPIHSAILQLNPSQIITTNYDNLIEQAIQANYKQYDIIRQDSDLPYYRYPNKVIKMHGDFSIGNIVLSEDDYYNYTRKFPLIRSFVSSLFTTNVVLFVGFSFDDLNLKIILNEIKTILDKNMQRVYLLTDDNVDKEMHEYYENKGINVVSITNPDNYIIDYGIEINQIEVDKFRQVKGANLYKQLQIIKSFDKDYKEDLLKVLYKRLRKSETELNVLGDGLQYFFPKQSIKYWNYYSYGIQIESSYFVELEKKLKTYSGKRQFVSLFPKRERDFLLQEAYVNQIQRIDSFDVITTNNVGKIQRSFDDKLIVDSFYELNFVKLYEDMKLLRTQGMSYNKNDLCLPYVLCRLGRYYDAYLIYKELLPKFWDKQLYVLYFISLYNLYCIRYAILNDVSDKRDIDADVIVKGIEKFDLDLILRQLPIDYEIKRTFNDLISSKYFSKKSNDAEELSRQIHKQKKQADNGGASINSNADSLVSKFLQTYNFCVSNSIEFSNTYFYSLITDTVSGILLSHITKDNRLNGLFKPTKIESLEWSHVFVLLFFMNTNDLSEILKLHDVKELIIKDESLKDLERIITNLYDALYINDRFVKPDFKVQIISNIIGNIVIILGCSKTTISKEVANKIYRIIHDLWSRPICMSVLTHLHLMMAKYKPSNEMAIYLLDDAIKLDKYKSISIANIISKQLQENNLLFDRIKDISMLINETEGQLGMTLYNVLPSNVQSDYMTYVQNNSKRLPVYVIILKNLHVGVTNVSVFEQLLKNPNFTRGFKEEQLTTICWIFADFRKNAMYANVHPIIDAYGEQHEQYKFYLDPIGYKDIDKINTMWLLRLEEPVLKELGKNNIIKEKVKTSVLSGELTKAESDKLVKNL